MPSVLGAMACFCSPYLTGERTLDLPNSTGIFKGLTLANFTAPHMARAAFEGVTFGLGYDSRASAN